jgi:N-acetylmuramoyl-L-alanine amidase
VHITKDADTSSCGFDKLKVKLTLSNRYRFEKERTDTIFPRHIVKFENIPLGHYDIEVFCKGYLIKKDYVHVKFPGPDTHWNGHFRKSRNRKHLTINTRYPMPKYIVNHIQKTTHYNRRPGTAMTPEYLTIHSTGNPTSTAQGERSWLTNTTNQRTASYHLVVDEKNVIECLPFNEMAWHAGDGASGTGNSKSIGLEICESGNRKKTLKNAIALAVKVLNDRGWNESNLKRHYDWPNSKGKRKQCPRILISPKHRKDYRQTWEWFKSEVKAQLKLIG